MFLINRWSNKVDDKIFVLLEKWVEKRICSICKTPYLPVETERYIVEKKYNRFGVAIFETILLYHRHKKRVTEALKYRIYQPS